jgi:hypothetical protein
VTQENAQHVLQGSELDRVGLLAVYDSARPKLVIETQEARLIQ